MAVPGRRPKPTAIKLIEGNPGGRPLNNTLKLAPITDLGCPAWLNDYGRAEWDRTSLLLANIGVLADVDHAVLSGYCQSFGRWREVEEKLDRVEKALTRTPNGTIQTNPLYWIANKEYAKMLKAAVELGLTPSARGQIDIKANRPDNPFTEHGI